MATANRDFQMTPTADQPHRLAWIRIRIGHRQTRDRGPANDDLCYGAQGLHILCRDAGDEIAEVIYMQDAAHQFVSLSLRSDLGKTDGIVHDGAYGTHVEPGG